MTLEGRLARLEPRLVERWRAAWEGFRALAAWNWGLATTPGRPPGLYLRAWHGWFHGSGPTDPDGRAFLRCWPRQVPPPPAEPEGAWRS